MNQTALITGATGLLGRKVLQAFERGGWKAIGTGFSRANPPSILKVDLSDQAAINSTLEEIKPQVVVHCAANRFPDKCEVDREGARALNIDASRRLAQATSSRSILLIYISTDYVFSGKPGEAPYEANASAEPSNFYGKTKLDGETAVLEETKETNLGVVLRVPVLYGTAENPEESAINVLMNAIWKAQEKNAKVIMDDWAQRYPTNTEDVGRVCFDIAKTYIAANDRSSALPKVLQFTSEDKLTKFEICQLFAEIMGLPFSGMQGNKESGGSDTSVHKPYDTHLSNQNLKDLGISVQTQDFRAWWRWEMNAVRK